MTFLEIFQFLKEVNRYSSVPGILFFLVFLTRVNLNTRIVFYIISVSFLADFLNYFFIRYIYPNAYIITNSWYLVNYVLVSWLFLKLIPTRKNLVVALLIFFGICSTLSFTFFFTFMEPNTFIRSFTSLSFTFLALLSFFEILKESPSDRLSQYPVFWIVTAVFLFSSITLIKNLFDQYLVIDMNVSRELHSYVHFFTVLANIVKNLCFLYAFMLVKRGYPDYIYPKTKQSV